MWNVELQYNLNFFPSGWVVDLVYCNTLNENQILQHMDISCNGNKNDEVVVNGHYQSGSNVYWVEGKMWTTWEGPREEWKNLGYFT